MELLAQMGMAGLGDQSGGLGGAGMDSEMNALLQQLQAGQAGGLGGGGGGMANLMALAAQGQGKGKGGGGKEGGGKGKGAAKIAAGEQVYFGKIKTYDAEKQRGYIVCEEVWNMSGCDVYAFGKVLEQSMAGPGDTVAFFLHRQHQQDSRNALLLASALQQLMLLGGWHARASSSLDRPPAATVF